MTKATLQPSVALFCLASHADILRGSSHVPAPLLLTWAKKNIDQSQQTSRCGKCTLDLDKFRAWLYSSRKGKEGLMKGDDLTMLEQTKRLTHKRSYQRLPWQSHWKIRPLRLICWTEVGFATKQYAWKKFCFLFSLTFRGHEAGLFLLY